MNIVTNPWRIPIPMFTTSIISMEHEPPRVWRRLQLLRDWGHGNEEDVEELFT